MIQRNLTPIHNRNSNTRNEEEEEDPTASLITFRRNRVSSTNSRMMSKQTQPETVQRGGNGNNNKKGKNKRKETRNRSSSPKAGTTTKKKMQSSLSLALASLSLEVGRKQQQKKQQFQKQPLLFALIEHQEWSQAIERIQSHPTECETIYDKHTALSWACQNQAPIDFIDELLLILETGGSMTSTCSRGSSRNWKEDGTNVTDDDDDRHGRGSLHLPLHVALQAQASNEVIQRILITDPSAARIPDENGQYPLHWVVHIAQFIDNNNNNNTTTTTTKSTATTTKTKTKMTTSSQQLLLRQGGAEDEHDINDNDGEDGITNQEIVRMILIAYPQACQLVNCNGQTPWDLAYDYFDSIPEILRILDQAPLWETILMAAATTTTGSSSSSSSSTSAAEIVTPARTTTTASSNNAKEIRRLQQALNVEQENSATMKEELTSLRDELEHAREQLLKQQGIFTQIQGMIIDATTTATTTAAAAQSHQQTTVVSSNNAKKSPRMNTELSALRVVTDPLMSTESVPTSTAPTTLSSYLRKTNPKKHAPATTMASMTGRLSTPGHSPQRPSNIPQFESYSIEASDSHISRQSVEDNDEEREPPPVPSYRKDVNGDFVQKPSSTTTSLSATTITTTTETISPRRSKSVPRPSRAAVQEWLSSGSRDVSELSVVIERPKKESTTASRLQQYQQQQRQNGRRPAIGGGLNSTAMNTVPSISKSASSDKIVYSHSLLERSRSNTKNTPQIRRRSGGGGAGALATRAAERVKQTRQQASVATATTATTASTREGPAATSSTMAYPTTTANKNRHNQRKATTTKPTTNATLTATTKATTMNITKSRSSFPSARPNSSSPPAVPSTFLPLKPTGLVRTPSSRGTTPTSTTKRRFEFDGYYDDNKSYYYSDGRDDDDDVVVVHDDNDDDFRSDAEEDPTIYSRAEWDD